MIDPPSFLSVDTREVVDLLSSCSWTLLVFFVLCLDVVVEAEAAVIVIFKTRIIGSIGNIHVLGWMMVTVDVSGRNRNNGVGGIHCGKQILLWNVARKWSFRRLWQDCGKK